jgi:glycosyltransferase involved in cell wall biosynthesis
MNILFVLYGDFSSNSVHPLALYARELHKCGHNCAVVVPNNLETIQQCPNVFFRPLLYDDALHDPESIFPDGRPADVIHAWTPREVVRRFVTSYMAKRPTPLIVYLEDHESWIACRALGLEEAVLVQQTDQSISERIRDGLSHPFRYDSFIGLADAAAVIQDKLEVDVPPWVHCETVMPGVDLEFFSPRMADPLLRKQYGIAENERVIVYPGGLNEFTRSLIETLCRAVCLINKQGYPCRLLRTGPFALDFIDQLPPEAATLINDLGVLPRSELPNLLALADVFVQPGKIDPFEDLRLPGKLPELLAMGRPVVMPDVNIAHLFEDGVNAVLTHTGSAEEIAAKCIELFSDPQQAERIGQGGRKFAEQYFDLKTQAKRLENVYDIACDNFNPKIAKEIWRIEDENAPVTLLLARKLKLLADSQSTKFGFEAGEILKEHARYIEAMQLRVGGLETGIAERDGLVHDKEVHIGNLETQVARLSQVVHDKEARIGNLETQVVRLSQVVYDKEVHIGNLDHALKEREHQISKHIQDAAEIRESTSWRLTRPVRFVGHQSLRIKIAHKAMPYALSMCGGYRGLIKQVWGTYKNEGIGGIKRRMLFSATPGAPSPTQPIINDYSEWVRRYDTLTDQGREKIKTQINHLHAPPLISVVMPVYNPPLKMLEDAIRSVQGQLYTHWELCIADDASTDVGVHKLLQRYMDNDSRIKVVFRKNNGHISAASNSALELVNGAYVALLDNDDLLSEHALFWIADAIVNNPNAGLIYSDEDKIDRSGRRYAPYFKSDWNPDLFLSHNMICHLGAYRTDLVKKLGGFREGYEGAQDYDLALRCSEQLAPLQIVHIPRVLYHWRSHPGSTALAGNEKNYALLAGERALNDHFARTQVSAKVELLDFGMYRAQYAIPESAPLVSLIIPTRNGLSLVKQCIDSLFAKTTYKNFEVLIVDNNSDDPKTLDYFASLADNKKIRVLRDERPFNYSALNNAAVNKARGEYVGLINNDIEVISPEWLDEMISLAIQPGVGAVGARLWYPNDTLQHGGVITGLGGLAGHSHKHLDKGAPGFFYRAQLIQTLSAVTAACLIIKKSIYEEVGGLDETNLKVAFNDVDFCLRVREAGYRNVWTPYAELYHHESATRGYEDTPEKQLRFRDEVLYMQKRWGNLLMNDPAYSPNLTLDSEDFSYAWPPRINSI